MRFTIDTNILVYSVDKHSPAKQAMADRIIACGRQVGMVLATQVLGEFCNAIHRKRPLDIDHAVELVDLWSAVFPVLSTGPHHIAAAARLAARYRLQFWDSVILEVARSESVGVLLSEDMQDGATFDGVTIMNPFENRNAASLDRLLTR